MQPVAVVHAHAVPEENEEEEERGEAGDRRESLLLEWRTSRIIFVSPFSTAVYKFSFRLKYLFPLTRHNWVSQTTITVSKFYLRM